MNTIVIDTNVLISALIKDGITRRILTSLEINFIFPEFGLEEIYLNKSEIMEKSELGEKEFNMLLLRLLKYVRLIPTNMIIEFREKADEIIGKIHKEDTAFIATSLAFNCPIWSEDKHFKNQNKIKIINTKEIIQLLSS